MANCEVCGKKMSFLEGKDLQSKAGSTPLGPVIKVCESCEGLLRKWKSGDMDAYCQIKELVGETPNFEMEQFMSLWAHAPTSVEVEREKERQEAKTRQDAALPSILISSGFNFEGYKIVKYSGYISGDDAIQIPRGGVFGTNNGQNLTDALVKIRRQALQELKRAAYDLGCNAVIGVDFDYITLEPQTASLTGGTLYEPYVICVTANGNAVIIEKE